MECQEPDEDAALYAKKDEEWGAFCTFIKNLCPQLGPEFASKIENLEKMYQDIECARLFHDILFLSDLLVGEKEGNTCGAFGSFSSSFVRRLSKSRGSSVGLTPPLIVESPIRFL